MDSAEVLQRVRASAVDSSVVEALGVAVEQLCCDYSGSDARALLATGKEWLSGVVGLVGSSVALRLRRDVFKSAGMLALLVGCLEYDLGDATSAEGVRRIALELGVEAGDPAIVGWAHEMLAWFRLTSGDHLAVVSAADAGIRVAGARSVSVQLYGQQAKAYARMGMPDKVHESLDKGRALLGDLPYPERPDHHFVFDPGKWDFFAMDAYRIGGQNQLARLNAEGVLACSVHSDGVVVAPMRRAEALLTLAVLAAREGDMDSATSLGVEALQDSRQSRPSLLMVAGELATLGVGADFCDLLTGIGGHPPAG